MCLLCPSLSRLYLRSLSLVLSFTLVFPHTLQASPTAPPPSTAASASTHGGDSLSRSFPPLSPRPPPAREFHRCRQFLHLRSLVAQTEVGGGEVVRGLGTQPALTSRRSGRVRYHPRESMTSPHKRPLKSVHNGQAIFPIFQEKSQHHSHNVALIN